MSVQLSLHGEPARYATGAQELRDGVWAWLQPNGGWGEANAGLVVGEGESLLVDTLWDEALTRTMLDGFGPTLASAPISVVVNSHSDGDHWYGNAAVPGSPEFVTSQRSAGVMAGLDPAELVRFRSLASALARLPGGPGAFGGYVKDMLGPFRFAEVSLRRPDRTFSGEETITVGGRDVRLIEVGPAHTPGDAVVHVPHAGVVFAADVLFVATTPVIWSGPLANWTAALDRLLELDADVYVPGHGPLAGKAEIDALRGYWAWLEEEARGAHARGLSASRASNEIARSSGFRDAPWATWGSPERLVMNVAALYREWEGKPIPTSPIALIRLFWDVAALARELG